MSSQSQTQVGRDTVTGTDPEAKYDRPGYEDKSFGQAGNQDQELVDRLVEDAHGDLDEAAERFEEQSAGAPALARQSAGTDHPTGEAKADRNRDADPPA